MKYAPDIWEKSGAFYSLCGNAINKGLQLEISHPGDVRLVSSFTLMLVLVC